MKYEIKTHHWIQDGKTGINYRVYENGKLITEELEHKGHKYERKGIFDTEQEAKSFLAYHINKG